MEIIPMSLEGKTLNNDEINRLVLENEICTGILSRVLEMVNENNE